MHLEPVLCDLHVFPEVAECWPVLRAVAFHYSLWPGNFEEAEIDAHQLASRSGFVNKRIESSENWE